MISIINQETSTINSNTKPMKEGIYLTTRQDIEKRGQLIEHRSAVYTSDNKKYTNILNEKMIIRFKYSKSSKNNLMETVSFLKDHTTSTDCQKSIESTSRYFLNKANIFLYPNYTKADREGGYSYYYQGFIGMNVPTMEFYCEDTIEIAKINMIKEKFFTDYQLN